MKGALLKPLLVLCLTVFPLWAPQARPDAVAESGVQSDHRDGPSVSPLAAVAEPMNLKGGASGIAAGEFRITVSDGTELYLAVRGRGVPCVYIHGGPGVGAYWMEKLYGEELERHFTMIYLDQRGSGRSGSASNGNYPPERMAKDLDEVRQFLGLDSWVTFGHSFGGIIQVEHARLFPETVLAMMMVSPTLNLSESVQGMIDFSLATLGISEESHPSYVDENRDLLANMMNVFGMMRKEGLFWKLHYADPENYARMDAVMAEVSRSNAEFAQRSLRMAEYYENYKPLASSLTMPVLYYYGMKDFAVGQNHHQDIHFPNMTLRSWNGGHVPFMEGKRELEQAITEWLGALQKESRSK